MIDVARGGGKDTCCTMIHQACAPLLFRSFETFVWLSSLMGILISGVWHPTHSLHERARECVCLCVLSTQVH